MGPRLANEDEGLPPGLEDVPWPIYLLAAFSPIVVFLINELVKLQEIKYVEFHFFYLSLSNK
jgi:hypothetical protein